MPASRKNEAKLAKRISSYENGIKPTHGQQIHKPGSQSGRK